MCLYWELFVMCGCPCKWEEFVLLCPSILACLGSLASGAPENPHSQNTAVLLVSSVLHSLTPLSSSHSWLVAGYSVKFWGVGQPECYGLGPPTVNPLTRESCCY